MRKFLLFVAAAMVAMSANAAYYLRGDLAGASWNTGVELVGGSITFDAVEGVNYEFKITEAPSTLLLLKTMFSQLPLTALIS